MANGSIVDAETEQVNTFSVSYNLQIFMKQSFD